MEVEFAERGWIVLEDLEVEQEVVHWVELVGVDWGANQRKAAPPPQLVDPAVQPNLDISLELGTNSLVIWPDGFTATANRMFKIAEWIRSKRSIFMLLIELSVALVHLLEKGWTAVTQETFQSRKVAQKSCDR